MNLIRFLPSTDQSPRYGALKGEVIRETDSDISALAGADLKFNGREHGLSRVRILPPVGPSKIVCVGRNYRQHAEELGNKVPEEPLLFLKPPSSLIAHGETIMLPAASERVEHEGELGVVIGREARRLGADEDPLSYVLGYTCLNDVTARDLQRKDVQFTRAKSFDTFCPAGPFISTGIDPSGLRIETRVNGELRQSGDTSQMIFPVPSLIRYISQIMTLNPGDLIATGTPAGVGPLRDGDTVEVEIEEVGKLENKVRGLYDDGPGSPFR
jgi:2-keto-4-pentenoate hydratase/2-oxohepta-3-ene-1,7-dioic acid hydratase in catechol pathway